MRSISCASQADGTMRVCGSLADALEIVHNHAWELRTLTVSPASFEAMTARFAADGVTVIADPQLTGDAVILVAFAPHGYVPSFAPVIEA